MAETAWPVLAQTYTYYGPQVWEFHVVQLMAGVMSGNFHPGRITQMLAPLGQDGWQCVGIIEVSRIGGGLDRGGIVALMQRPLRPMTGSPSQ
jgi:hypothetical protein